MMPIISKTGRSHDLLPPRTFEDLDNDIFMASSFESQSGLLEPLIIDDDDPEVHPAIFRNRLRTSIPRWMRPKRTEAWFKGRAFGCKSLLRGGSGRRLRLTRILFGLFICYVLFLGIIQLFHNILDVLDATYPDDMDWILHRWGLAGEETESWAHWPTDATGNINPVSCHSHNDYWRPVPFYSAIYAGCTGAEADIWFIDDELYVGHTRYALTTNRTLNNLYINPLLDLLEKQNSPIKRQSHENSPDHTDAPQLNGIFDVDPTQNFVLLIDFKTNGPELWWKLLEQLAPLQEKGYLTFFNGSEIVQKPITVVATGKAPFELLTANETYRHVFYDAPLSDFADLSSQWPNPNRAQDPTRGPQHPSLPQLPHAEPDQAMSGALADPARYDPTNSYYASTSFTRSIGKVWGSRLTQAQLQLIRGQIRGAHQRGLKVRYWSLPQWPIGLRNHVWHILMREGVDILNVDDLRHATRRDWRRKKGWLY